MSPPRGPRSWNVVPLTPWTASLKVTVAVASRLTAVALVAGAVGVMGGGHATAAVVKLQLVVTSGAPAVSRICEVPPRSVTVYWVPGDRFAPGLRIHWFVVPWVTVPPIGAEVGWFAGRMTKVEVFTPVTDS